MLRIHCQEPWFSKIRSGLKKVEGRKHNNKYFQLKPGDLLEFYCDEKSFLTEVIEVKAYKLLPPKGVSFNSRLQSRSTLKSCFTPSKF